jgi:hypothetical protein
MGTLTTSPAVRAMCSNSRRYGTRISLENEPAHFFEISISGAWRQSIRSSAECFEECLRLRAFGSEPYVQVRILMLNLNERLLLYLLND